MLMTASFCPEARRFSSPSKTPPGTMQVRFSNLHHYKTQRENVRAGIKSMDRTCGRQQCGQEATYKAKLEGPSPELVRDRQSCLCRCSQTTWCPGWTSKGPVNLPTACCSKRGCCSCEGQGNHHDHRNGRNYCCVVPVHRWLSCLSGCRGHHVRRLSNTTNMPEAQHLWQARKLLKAEYQSHYSGNSTCALCELAGRLVSRS